MRISDWSSDVCSSDLVIYPVTKGKPLGRRIRQSELKADNGYNTYARAGLPQGPIANPGRESIAAVLDPEPTKALYFVADGTGGHLFADTLADHQAYVDNCFARSEARCVGKACLRSCISRWSPCH